MFEDVRDFKEFIMFEDVRDVLIDQWKSIGDENKKLRKENEELQTRFDSINESNKRFEYVIEEKDQVIELKTKINTELDKENAYFAEKIEEIEDANNSLENYLKSAENALLYKDKLLDTVELIINKIIPEYKDVPIEYKILLFKERTNSENTVSNVFCLNKSEIDLLANKLKEGNKLSFIKEMKHNVKPFEDMELKELKELSDRFDFKKERNFEECVKEVKEKF